MKTKQEIEEEFDKKYGKPLILPAMVQMNGDGDTLLVSVSSLKSHISSLRQNDLESVREWAKWKKRQDIFLNSMGRQEMSKTNRGYNTAISDLLSHLTEELKNII